MTSTIPRYPTGTLVKLFPPMVSLPVLLKMLLQMTRRSTGSNGTMVITAVTHSAI